MMAKRPPSQKRKSARKSSIPPRDLDAQRELLARVRAEKKVIQLTRALKRAIARSEMELSVLYVQLAAHVDKRSDAIHHQTLPTVDNRADALAGG